MGLFIFGCFSAAHINIKKISIVFILIFIYHIIPAYYSLLTGQANVLFSNIRVSGEFQNVGQFGMLMGLAFIIFYILYLKSRVLSYKIIFAFLIMLALAILAFNNTLRIFAAIVFAFSIYYILYKRKIKYLFIIAIFVLLLILFNAQVYQRLYELFTVSYKLEELSEMKFDNSFQWRIMQWYLLTSDWIKNYFISGVGLGQQTMLKGFIAPWGEPFVAHSDFVKLLVETGFIGFPLILIICFSIASFIKKEIYVSQFALVILYFLFCLLTGNTMFSNPFQIFIFLIGYLSSYKEY
ncbi:MAG: O-antigen ligase family protein [Bacteroidales bacterium]|nr:O-antigen ligase family protein [Bacteroidales bacterium]